MASGRADARVSGGPPGGPGARRVRTVLADDNRGFLDAAGRYLATQSVEVVGMASTGLETLRLLDALKPELLMLDLEMPDLDGLAVLRLVKSREPAPRVIVVTLHDHEQYRTAAARAGADGFVPKRAFTTELVPLIRRLFGIE
jgi:DNA-binding NarL/FixJ family response regulator